MEGAGAGSCPLDLGDRKAQVLELSILDYDLVKVPGLEPGAGPPCVWVLVLVPCCGIGAIVDAGAGDGSGTGAL